MKKAIDAVLTRPWAITPDALETIASIAERENEYQHNLEALEKKLGRPLGNAYSTTVRDGVAVVPVQGPMFRYANLMTMFSGATSYDMLAKDFNAALTDPSVKAIVLSIDSPGGEVNGASEFAQHIAAGRGKKPIYAYVGGTGASAAYWVASAADKIFAADTALIGSIGVQMGLKVAESKSGEKTFRFVSSQSPNKNASPETETGATQIQQTVDQLAQVFIDAVASNRNTSAENVLESFGQGAVFVAAEAVNRGMIDGISTLEAVLHSVNQELTSMNYAELTASTLAEHRPDLVEAIRSDALASVERVDADAVRAEAVATERQRLTELDALAVPGTEDLIAKFKADGTDASVAAIEIVKAMKAKTASKGADALAVIKTTEAELVAPTSAAAQESDSDKLGATLELARAHGAIR